MTISFQGLNCAAVLDGITMTLTHSGLTTPRHKKRAPWVIPVGAIESIEHRPTTWKNRGYVRFLVRGGVGWHELQNVDMNAFFLSKKFPADEFLAAVEAARVGVPPVDMPAKAPSGLLKDLASGSASVPVSSGGTTFEGVTVSSKEVTFNGQTFPVAGVRAAVEVGGVQRRTTATRVVVGSALTLGIGTVIGALAKKKTQLVYLSVDLADGQQIIVELPPKKETDARAFAAKVNNVGAQAASSATAATAQTPIASAPPPPPSVPAGWYPDPHGQPLQRYWGGVAWTEHTAPLSASEG